MSDTRPCPRCAAAEARLRHLEPPFRVVACRRCGLVYLANPPDETLLYEDYYEGAPPPPSAYRPGSDVRGLAELHAINTQRCRLLRRMAPGGRLLDVGCGRGFFLASAREHGYEVTGVDVSERAVAYAREAFDVDARVQSIDDLAAGGARFDVLTLWHVLEHFLDPFDTLRRLRGLLVDGGLCLVEVPNLHSLKFVLSRSKWEGGNHPRYHRTFFTPRTLLDALREAGFRDVRRLPLSYRIPGHPAAYTHLKEVLNRVGLDAFLDVSGRR